MYGAALSQLCFLTCLIPLKICFLIFRQGVNNITHTYFQFARIVVLNQLYGSRTLIKEFPGIEPAPSVHLVVHMPSGAHAYVFILFALMRIYQEVVQGEASGLLELLAALCRASI